MLRLRIFVLLWCLRLDHALDVALSQKGTKSRDAQSRDNALLFLAATPVPPPFIPWVLAPHQTLAIGHPVAGTAAVPFLGTTLSEADCRTVCAAQPNCTEYVWNNSSAPEWRNRCYGRHDTMWILTPSANSYSGRRVVPSPGPPTPKPPGPPAPVPPGAVSLRLAPGTTVDPYFFGWNLESWGQDINLTYADTAGLAYTTALHTGVLRYPGGTGSNIWDPKAGHFLPDRIPAVTPARAYAKYRGFMPFIDDLPTGTLSAAHFVQGLGGTARRVVWDLNVFVFNASEACGQIEYISTLPGQQAPGTLLELGNELYSEQGLPRFPNSTAYATAMLPIIECARRLMPAAKIGFCGLGGSWNQGLRPFLHLVDGVSHHTYAPRRAEVAALPQSLQVSYVAGYSRAAARADLEAQNEDLGRSLPMWLTEYGYGLDSDDSCMLPKLMFGALHGAFHVARVIEAINTPGAFATLCFERFVFANPPTTNQPNDWCGMSAGTVAQDFPNTPDRARVTGMGQLVAHFFASALAHETMHPVNVSNSPLTAVEVLGERQPCVQAAAFTSATALDTVAVAVLNICNTSIAITIDATVLGEPYPALASAIVYDLRDPGGKAALPSNPEQFPWAGPLRAHSSTVSGSLYTAPPLSFAIVI